MSVTYASKVVQYVPLCLVREDEVGRDGERGARHERDERRDMRDLVEPVQGRSPQAPVYEKGVVVAHEREANHADGLEHPIPEDGKARARVAFQVWGDVWAFDEYRGDNNEHANKCQSGGAGELVDVAVEGERVGDADGAESDDKLALCEEIQDRDGIQVREYRANDVGYRVT